MKKLIIMAMLFAACQSENHNGFYYHHAVSKYSIADDTIEVIDDHIIDHVGYQRIRQGRLLPKEFKSKELLDVYPRFEKGYIIFGTIRYKKIN